MGCFVTFTLSGTKHRYFGPPEYFIYRTNQAGRRSRQGRVPQATHDAGLQSLKLCYGAAGLEGETSALPYNDANAHGVSSEHWLHLANRLKRARSFFAFGRPSTFLLCELDL